MLTRNIYFIRHGETILNAAHIRQSEGGALSSNGVSQAFSAGQRLKAFNIQKIFCSPFQRAVETCDEVNKSLSVQSVEYVPLLGERKNPSEIVGLNYNDPLTVKAVNFMDKSYHEPDARWSDEENFQDLKDRAIKCLDFLSKNSSVNTLCITHGIFLKMLLCIMAYGKDLSVETYIKMSLFNPADNAGITIVEYHPLNFFSNPWEIVAYNDSPISSESLKI